MTLPMPQSDRPIPDPPVAMPAAEQESFVINLCSSTTPMALTQPQLVELKRYKFFVSRRLEDGRERFRLHMGYFNSLPQADYPRSAEAETARRAANHCRLPESGTLAGRRFRPFETVGR